MSDLRIVFEEYLTVIVLWRRMKWISATFSHEARQLIVVYFKLLLRLLWVCECIHHVAKNCWLFLRCETNLLFHWQNKCTFYDDSYYIMCTWLGQILKVLEFSQSSWKVLEFGRVLDKSLKIKASFTPYLFNDNEMIVLQKICLQTTKT